MQEVPHLLSHVNPGVVGLNPLQGNDVDGVAQALLPGLEGGDGRGHGVILHDNDIVVQAVSRRPRCDIKAVVPGSDLVKVDQVAGNDVIQHVIIAQPLDLAPGRAAGLEKPVLNGHSQHRMETEHTGQRPVREGLEGHPGVGVAPPLALAQVLPNLSGVGLVGRVCSLPIGFPAGCGPVSIFRRVKHCRSDRRDLVSARQLDGVRGLEAHTGHLSPRRQGNEKGAGREFRLPGAPKKPKSSVIWMCVWPSLPSRSV